VERKTIPVFGCDNGCREFFQDKRLKHESVQEAKAGDEIGIKVGGRVRKKDKVYKK